VATNRALTGARRFQPRRLQTLRGRRGRDRSAGAVRSMPLNAAYVSENVVVSLDRRFAPALPIVGVQASGESCGDQDVGLNLIVGIRHYLGPEPREIGITLTPARQDGLAAVEAFVDAAARAYEVRSPLRSGETTHTPAKRSGRSWPPTRHSAPGPQRLNARRHSGPAMKTIAVTRKGVSSTPLSSRSCCSLLLRRHSGRPSRGSGREVKQLDHFHAPRAGESRRGFEPALYARRLDRSAPRPSACTRRHASAAIHGRGCSSTRVATPDARRRRARVIHSLGVRGPPQ
jgi:hypothetical protein